MNVLFITADQWRGDCLGATGHPVVKTPNVDRLASQGVLIALCLSPLLASVGVWVFRQTKCC